MKYKVIYDTEPRKFEQKVERAFREGYNYLGAFQVLRTGSDYAYFQTVAKLSVPRIVKVPSKE